jgi:uncharacterized phage protein gp47/JayE
MAITVILSIVDPIFQKIATSLAARPRPQAQHPESRRRSLGPWIHSRETPAEWGSDWGLTRNKCASAIKHVGAGLTIKNGGQFGAVIYDSSQYQYRIQ